jgi:predicted porin
MNNKIKLAVAGAVLSAASAANAGIIIPAGEWTVDINGNVNAFATWTSADKAHGTNTNGVRGGLASPEDGAGEDNNQGINTGLLPAWLGFTGTTRQNDVDVSWTISMQPGVSENSATGDNGMPNAYAATLWRQAFLTFGDKSWGTVKLGKDLGIFAGQAILNDMTLLGVGGGSNGSGAVTTLGGIGSGYIYPAWKGQVSYTTPNMNGFQATIAITNPDQNFGTWVAEGTDGYGNNALATKRLYQDRFGYEGQVMYSWSGDVAGKVWASGASYDVTGNTVADGTALVTSEIDDYRAQAWDIGANVNVGNLGLVAYWYEGKGAGTTFFGSLGADAANNKFDRRDSDGGYLQATYVIPTGTKLGVSYGVSRLDKANASDTAVSTSAATGNLLDENKRWTVGAYHPLTKHLNLVAEYNDMKSESHGNESQDSSSFSLGAILFF